MTVMSREELAELATAVYGSQWQAALSREKPAAPRSVQRWAADGIGKPGTAAAIRAFLLTRRIIDLPPAPANATDEDRDDEAHAVMMPLLGSIVAAGERVGWHPAELLTATLSAAIDFMVEGAGAPATIETMEGALAQLRTRVAH